MSKCLITSKDLQRILSETCPTFNICIFGHSWFVLEKRIFKNDVIFADLFVSELYSRWKRQDIARDRLGRAVALRPTRTNFGSLGGGERGDLRLMHSVHSLDLRLSFRWLKRIS